MAPLIVNVTGLSGPVVTSINSTPEAALYVKPVKVAEPKTLASVPPRPSAFAVPVNAIAVEVKVSMLLPETEIAPAIGVADALGAIARAVAIASKARQSFFILTSY
jgi:hypothetical protein